MSDLQKALETTEATIEALQSYAENIRDRMKQAVGGAKFKQWEPVGGSWFINQCDDAVEKWSASHEETKQAGLERPTEQQAERAAVEMRKFNRLLALRDELCGDDVIEQNTAAQKYIVYFSAVDKRWWVTDCYINYITPVFSTQSSALRACDMLNSGEVVL
jgi:hypothetical protein